jgi:parallel beta-helix repeat protein
MVDFLGNRPRRTPLRAACLIALTAAAALLLTNVALASHVSCGQVITADTTLDSDLVECPGDGIVIGAAGITLDLAGHTVSATTPLTNVAGVSNDGFGAVTVRNGVIRNFYYGVSIWDADGTAASGLTIEPGRYSLAGIAAYRSPGSRITANVVVANGGGSGIVVTAEAEVAGNTVVGGPVSPSACIAVRDDADVRGNSASGCSDGVVAFGTASVIARNRLFSNVRGLIVEGLGHENLVEHNTILGNTRHGIELYGSPGNVIDRNEVHDNGDAGIALDLSIYGSGSSDNLIARNDVSGSWQGMVTGPNAGPNRFIRNDAHDNGYGGFSIGGKPGSLVERNQADRNGYWGIGADAGVTVTHNSANFNGTWGIYGPAATDGGGNHAMGNGDPRECFGIVCR